ncbi:MAG: hypothetical protein K2X81_20860 [Candidatus Obscuribacterales bacterium]|nr:hypothetical protein [Candidatus Obscuribacterales bacterium]
MSIHLQAAVLAGIMAFSAFSSAAAQESTQRQAGSRRIAMALPKVPEQTVTAKPVVTIPTANAPKAAGTEASVDPQSYNKASRATEIPENVRAVLIDGAAKAEQLSRSYNRRIADLIVWIASSWTQPSKYTPAQAPYFGKQRSIEPQPLTHNEHKSGYIFQID